jgi:hypothetical protein
MAIATLQRSLASIKAQLDAFQATPDACEDGVALWARIYGTPPDDWQAAVLRSEHPRVLLNCSRQSGKSSISAVMALYEVLYRPPALVLLVSASLRQAQELAKKCFDGFRALGKPVPTDAENKLSLELRNGSRLICLPSKEQTIRGYSAARLIVADEASRIPDDVYHSIRPMLAVSGGQLIALSTPFGKRGWWYQEWAEGAGWEKVHITAEQCPRISAAFLAEERRSLPEPVFLSEYYGVFGDVLDSVFRYEDIAALLSDDVQPLFGSGHAQPFVSSVLYRP